MRGRGKRQFSQAQGVEILTVTFDVVDLYVETIWFRL